MANVGIQTLSATDIHDVTTDKQGTLGRTAMTEDGRRYRYAKNGAVALTAGATVIAPATTAYASTAKYAYRPNAHQVETAGTVATPANYEDGILTINGAGYLASGVTSGGVIGLVDGLDANVASGATTSLAANQFCGVTASATNPIGTAEVAVPAGAYFWARVSM